MSLPEGLLVLDKPAGITSHDVVDRVRRVLDTRKVGHAGTLDPMATGLMLIGVGRGTRLLRYLTGLDKAYDATARLGEETDTLDADGTVVRSAPVGATRDEVETAAARLVGESLQSPPAYSAVKVGGKKMYEEARAGREIQAAPRAVTVSGLRVTDFDGRDVAFSVECSSGTYVRVLAADLGASLGCGAHLVALRRTRVGPFLVERARGLEDEPDLLPVEEMVTALSRRDLTGTEPDDVAHGRPLSPSGSDQPVAVFDPSGRLLGVYRDSGDRARAEMVLAPR